MKKNLLIVSQYFIGITLLSFLFSSCKNLATEEYYLDSIQQNLNNEFLQSLDTFEQVCIEMNTNILNLDSAKIKELDSEFDLEKYKEEFKLEIKNTIEGLNVSRTQLYDINNCLNKTTLGQTCESLVTPILKPLSSSIHNKKIAINNELFDIIINKKWFKDFYVPEHCQNFQIEKFRVVNPFDTTDYISVTRPNKNKQIEQYGEDVKEFILEWTGDCSYNLKSNDGDETKREVQVEIIKTSPEGYTYIQSDFEDGKFINKYFGKVLIEK